LSRRVRAAAFAAAAAVCAGLAAGATGSEPDTAEQFGALRQVVVAAEPLPARRELRAGSLELRRVPESFVPPDALASPAQAVARKPVAPIPAGSYVVGSQLATRPAHPDEPASLRTGLVPVEVRVAAAGALDGRPVDRVDVVVTTEPSAAGSGRTYVAAPAVALLDLRAAGAEPGGELVPGDGGEAWVATLAVTRAQALRLIQAESFARSIRLIGR
jgi:Flp pilus assembly protein CpaB